jgi:hypothetical protein
MHLAEPCARLDTKPALGPKRKFDANKTAVPAIDEALN